MENQTFQDIMYRISHDTGAPARSIVSFSKLLEEELADKLNEKHAKWLKLILESGQDLQIMLNGLLSYSRIISHEAPRSDINLQTLLCECAKPFTGRLELKSNMLPTIKGIEYQWKEFFHQIISNAIDHNPSTKALKIDFSYDSANKKLLITDNGNGLSDSELKEATKLFWRGETGRTMKREGIGLSVCKYIAESDGNHFQLSLRNEHKFQISVIFNDQNIAEETR